jgi:predicted phage terminase large subunit-like protein
MIMQRLSENDPTGYLLSKKKSNVRHICLPGEIRNYEKELKPQSLKSNYIDGLLDPNRMPWYVLEEMEADLGQYGFAGQVGQRPTPPGGGMFKVDRFVNIQKMPPDVSIKQIVRYWDKAATDENEIKTGQKAAYTVGLKMAKTDYGKWIIMDVVRGRWDTDVREAKIRSVAEADGKNVKVYVEQEGGSGGKDSIRSTIRNLAGFFCEGDNPSGKGSKVQRADTFSVQVNNGNVLLLSGEWNQSLIDEYRLFPFSTYKDQVDAGSGAFNILTKKREARVL